MTTADGYEAKENGEYTGSDGRSMTSWLVVGPNREYHVVLPVGRSIESVRFVAEFRTMFSLHPFEGST